MMSDISTYLQLDSLIYRVLAFLLAATLHDSIVAFTARQLGDRTARDQGRLSLNPTVHIAPFGLAMVLFGPYGWTKGMPIDPSKFRKSPRMSSIVLWLTGPLANLLLGILCWFIYRTVMIDSVDTSMTNQFLSEFLRFGVIVNLLYAIIHLIPLYPLGGWYALRSFRGLGPYGTDSSENKDGNRRFTIWEVMGLCITVILMVVPYGRWLIGQVYVIVERWITLLFTI